MTPAHSHVGTTRARVRPIHTLVVLAIALSCLGACAGTSDEPGVRVHAVTDKNLLWSPYTWITEGDARMSPTVGSYVDVWFKGTSIEFDIDTAPLSKAGHGPGYIWVSTIIDGGDPQRIALDKIEDGRLLRDDLAPGSHHARLTIARNMNIPLRWNEARKASLYLTGIATEGPLLAPEPAATKAPTALFYGDSIAEGNSVEGLGVFGDNSFAAVAMNKLGYRYAIHAYSGATWQYAPFARAGTFVDLDPDGPLENITWRNYFNGQSMLSTTSPHRYLEGSPDLILNNLGSNDIQVALQSQGYGRASGEYLAPAIEAWLTQVRAAAGPDTVIAMIQPVVYNCPEAYKKGQREEARVAKAAYQRGIADYAEAHPEDTRVLTIDLGEPACKVLLENKHSDEHSSPETAEATGDMLATALENALAKLPE